MHSFADNFKITDGVGLLVDLAPIDINNQTLPAAVVGWVPMAKYDRAIFYCMMGVIGAGATGTWTVQQAQDSTGTGVKTVGTHTQAYTDASDGTVFPIEIRGEELDVANGFCYVRVQVAASAHSALAAALCVRDRARYAQATLPT